MVERCTNPIVNRSRRSKGGKMTYRYLSDLTTLSLDGGKCTGCGRCTEVCPHAVFKIGNRKALIVDRDRCIECGACMMNCPAGAIDVKTGVGCAQAIIGSMRKGGEPGCGCGSSCCG
jgi:NAD-dependent dihydropyrimidine dehydrogenase PreA subunit